MKTSSASLTVSLAISVIAATACGPNERILNSANENRSEVRVPASNIDATPIPSTFKQDLESMRTADFKFVIAFRRKDGGKLEPDDKELIGRNTGPTANRRKLSDDGKAVIIGSNFPFEAKMLDELTKKFVMEDHSKPDSGPLVVDTNANANSNSNSNSNAKK